jgi:hypothetical protein
MASRIVSFRFPQELEARILEESQQGESFNDTARRILIDALGGQTLPPMPAMDIRGLIADAIAKQSESVDSRLQQVDSKAKAAVEALEERLLQLPPQPLPTKDIKKLIAESLTQYQSDVDSRIHASNTETKLMVETLIEEKLTQLPTKIPRNIPTQTQFQEMQTRINDFRGSLLREIQNRDKSINLFAEQIALLTARLDAMPAGISREELEVAKDKILNNWRVAKAPEKRERIEMGLNKLINEVAPLPSPLEPKTDSRSAEVADIKEKINPSNK